MIIRQQQFAWPPLSFQPILCSGTVDDADPSKDPLPDPGEEGVAR
jgi:hypothetical protein